MWTPFVVVLPTEKPKPQGVTPKQMCDSMYDFLKELGINAHRSTIVKAVAEKLNVWIPGLYDEDSL